MGRKQKRIWVTVVAVLLIVAGWSIWQFRQEVDLPKETLGNVGTEPQTETSGETEPHVQTKPHIQTEPQTETEPFKEAETDSLNPENAVTSLSAGNVDGSCVILYAEQERYIVATASHVMEEKTEKVWFAGQEVPVTGYWKSKDYDLAFLAIEFDGLEGIADLETAKVNIDTYGELKEQGEIHLYGVVAGEKVSQKGTLLNNWIYIEDFGYHMLWGEAQDIKGGMSGGGVFDSNGRLLGILLGSDGKSEIVALPINIIVGEWEQSDLAGTIDIFSN